MPEIGLEPTRYLNFATASQAAVASITPFGLNWSTGWDSNPRLMVLQTIAFVALLPVHCVSLLSPDSARSRTNAKGRIELTLHLTAYYRSAFFGASGGFEPT